MTDAIDFDNKDRRRKLKILQESHLFQGLAQLEYEQLADDFSIVSLEPGTRMFSQGTRGNSFFFVLAGNIQIVRTERGQDEVLSTLSRGDFFGEGALLTGTPRRASAMTMNAVSLMRMEREPFMQMMQRYPDIRRELVAVTQGYDIARRKKFEWVGEDEGMHLVARKHPMIPAFQRAACAVRGLRRLHTDGLWLPD